MNHTCHAICSHICRAYRKHMGKNPRSSGRFHCIRRNFKWDETGRGTWSRALQGDSKWLVNWERDWKGYFWKGMYVLQKGKWNAQLLNGLMELRREMFQSKISLMYISKLSQDLNKMSFLPSRIGENLLIRFFFLSSLFLLSLVGRTVNFMTLLLLFEPIYLDAFW